MELAVSGAWPGHLHPDGQGNMSTLMARENPPYGWPGKPLHPDGHGNISILMAAQDGC